MKQIEQQQGFMDLIDGIREYQAKRFESAESTWSPWVSQQDHVVGYFARSLAANLGEEHTKAVNLYNPDPVAGLRQIDLFREISRLPIIHWPRDLSARLHQSRCENASTLVELGIGSGEHAEQLVEACEGRITRVIGIDLDPAGVQLSGERLRARGVEYIGLATAFDELDWERLRLLAGPRVLADAAFALHHLPLSAKRDVLEGIASLAPKTVTLIEPSSDHWAADLLTRFVNAYQHFEKVGEMIGKLDVSQDIRRGILQFFGREIDDIMRDSPARFERHELWTFWYRELLRTGLRPLNLQASLQEIKIAGCEVRTAGSGVATIGKGSIPLVSVLAFGPPMN